MLATMEPLGETDALIYATWLPWARETPTWVLQTVLAKTWKLSAGATQAIQDVLKERGL